MSGSFSIVIPLFNKEICISATVGSVLAQTYKEFELIIVNDGSTDNSLKVVESIYDERIKIINKENGGVSSARNRGILEARYDWIAFLDGDDIWEPNFLEEMNDLIEEFPEASLFGSAFDYYSNNKIIKPNLFLPPLFRAIIHNYFQHARSTFLFNSSAVVVSKSALISLNGFDERIHMGEDIDLWYRINLKYKSAFFNKVLSHYNFDGPNRAMNRKREMAKSYWFYMDKFKEYEQDNIKFREFINWYRCRGFFDLFQHYEINKLMIDKFLLSISLDSISWKWKIYCKLPFFFKENIAFIYNSLYSR